MDQPVRVSLVFPRSGQKLLVCLSPQVAAKLEGQSCSGRTATEEVRDRSAWHRDDKGTKH